MPPPIPKKKSQQINIPIRGYEPTPEYYDKQGWDEYERQGDIKHFGYGMGTDVSVTLPPKKTKLSRLRSAKRS